MTEFIHAITSPVNLVLTVLLGCCMGYWLIVILGVLTPDAFDIDLDLDADGDVDVQTGGHGFGGASLIKFFNVGEVPLMILLSVFIGILWFTGVVLHPYIGAWSILFQVLMVVPMAVGSLLLTKVLTQPLKSLFRQLREDEHAAPRSFLGERCTIVSATATHKHGQAEFHTGGAPLRLNIRTSHEGEVLARGNEAVIVADRDDKGTYTVRGF